MVCIRNPKKAFPKVSTHSKTTLGNWCFSGKKLVTPRYPELSTVVAIVAYIIQHYCDLLLLILHRNDVYKYNESSSYGR